MDEHALDTFEEQAKIYCTCCSLEIGKMAIDNELLDDDSDENNFKAIMSSAKLIGAACEIIEDLIDQVNKLKERVEKLEAKTV